MPFALSLPSDFDTRLHAFQAQEIPNLIADLEQLVRIPSISKLPEHAGDCLKVLECVSELTQKLGFQTEIVKTPGLPVFIGWLETDPNAPWITIYNHMDVQPAEEPQWESAPFEPLLKDDRLYGRGSTDDKGPALTTLYAIAFLKRVGYALPNIQLIYETEEENGSGHFGWFLDHMGSRLKTPRSILVSDTIFEGEHPALTYRLRGLLQAEAELVSGSMDQHSGLVGGVVENPLNILIRALATCTDAQGNVTIPGVSAPVLNAEEQAALEKTAEVFDIQRLHQDTAGARFYSEDPREIIERIWCRPTFEVHGFEGIQTTPKVIKSALPYHVKAKLTLRLMAEQDPNQVLQALEKHLQSCHPAIQVNDRGQLRGCKTALDALPMQVAAAACKFGFGKAPLIVGSGGTIGALPQFQRVFPQAPLVLIAQSLMSDHYHGPNENFRLSQIHDGMRTMAAYLYGLTKV
ncbi:MAG: M20/M25/M40 family metallo-hydrolase [Candidatus Sericytochromatia bacterium]|nr:M20/M25/M40 family metallo-hydrolase [Candidatus Sericytochromatia bacterium]